MRAGFPAALVVAIAAVGLSACGHQASDIHDVNPAVNRGAMLFSQRCSGCHQLTVVGAEGGAMKVKDREKTDGPNFNVRKETKAQVLYAIENGGFSGAIMPENVVVGSDANAVADFLSQYAGHGKRNKTSFP